GADVVVRIPEIRIDLDGALAFSNRIHKLALKVVGPAEKRVRLGRGMQIQRRLIKLDGAIVVAFHLRLISVLQNFPSLREGLLGHVVIVTTGDALCLRYGSPNGAE